MARILIVEDNPQNRKLFSLFVGNLGHTAILAEDGRQGVATAREELPDCILMDIQMPVMSGIDALAELRQDPATRDIPVIALTAYAMKGDRQRLLDLGFDGYLAKPVGRADLAAALETVLAAAGRGDP